jgi:hypothetical protein
MMFKDGPTPDLEYLKPTCGGGMTGASDDIVDQVVSEINALQNRASLEAALGIGKIVIDRFYGGDLSIWRLHSAKEASFRTLAARADQDLWISATSLYRAVALYELERRIGITKFAGLTMTHLRIVLGLPEDKQTELLQLAEENRWSSERLERATLEMRGKMGKRTGRPASPPLFKAFRRLFAVWKHIEEVVHEEDSPELSIAQAQSLHVAIDELRGRLDRMSRHVVASVGGVATPLPTTDQPRTAGALSGRADDRAATLRRAIARAGAQNAD